MKKICIAFVKKVFAFCSQLIFQRHAVQRRHLQFFKLGRSISTFLYHIRSFAFYPDLLLKAMTCSVFRMTQLLNGRLSSLSIEFSTKKVSSLVLRIGQLPIMDYYVSSHSIMSMAHHCPIRLHQSHIHCSACHFEYICMKFEWAAHCGPLHCLDYIHHAYCSRRTLTKIPSRR